MCVQNTLSNEITFTYQLSEATFCDLQSMVHQLNNQLNIFISDQIVLIWMKQTFMRFFFLFFYIDDNKYVLSLCVDKKKQFFYAQNVLKSIVNFLIEYNFLS